VIAQFALEQVPAKSSFFFRSVQANRMG
jgi:hypothetical protein